MIAPDSHPAGNFAKPSAVPPIAPMARVSARRSALTRSDGAGTISSMPRETRDEALHGGFKLLRIAREAQPQEAAARGPERAARRQADAGFVDQPQGEAAGIGFPVDREEQIERALRHGEAALPGRRERAAGDVAPAPRAGDLMRHETLAALERRDRGALHELRNARGRILDHVLDHL